MRRNEITVYDIDGFDTESLEKVWKEWFLNFKKTYVDVDFKDNGGGNTQVEISNDKMSIEYTTKWIQTVQIVPKQVIVKDLPEEEEDKE